MAKCGIGQITDTECGESAKHQRKTKNEVISLVKCNRDISKHLQFCKISNEGISTEADLILCRAGKLVFLKLHVICWNLCESKYAFLIGIFDSSRKENIVVCSLHRDSLGIYWRGQYKNCQVPISIAAHSKRSRGDRSVGKRLSQSIFERTNELLPVGSCKCSISVQKQLRIFTMIKKILKSRCLYLNSNMQTLQRDVRLYENQAMRRSRRCK